MSIEGGIWVSRLNRGFLEKGIEETLMGEGSIQVRMGTFETLQGGSMNEVAAESRKEPPMHHQFNLGIFITTSSCPHGCVESAQTRCHVNVLGSRGDKVSA